jgi:hypothetical protein
VTDENDRDQRHLGVGGSPVTALLQASAAMHIDVTSPSSSGADMPLTLNVLQSPAGDGGVAGPPFLQLQYTFASPVERHGETFLADLKSQSALIDTGADYNLIDHSLIPTGATPERYVHSAGVHGEIVHAPLYPIRFYFVEAEHCILSQVIGADLSNTGTKILLGRLFLAKTRFTYDGPRGGIRLLELVNAVPLLPG